ncbi:hypothetical protein DPMN_188020 [Dreissena polymorpha]|uniref:Uncharacterized protein n=1 Tax=Dreissena polymorpha TaxID=45954 RepID=A0A9D4I9L9_DREPO|nr:hypothetical protein DPMN_188020 [Dreissena polymorpha]
MLFFKHTGTGQIGPCGLIAQLLVMWDFLNQTEPATIASVNQANIQCALMNPAAPGMVAGRVGVRGKAVQ